jgi:branched-chain amino acid transport system permease protein
VRRRTARAGAVAVLAALAVLACVPLFTRRGDVLNFLLLVLLAITLAESWNIMGGYAGQVNLGHAAFFGIGALVARTLWLRGTPILVAMLAGAVLAMTVALVIGLAAFRLRGAYFAIGTLALGEISRITVGNALPEISSLPGPAIATYRLVDRYWLALGVAALTVVVTAVMATSRLGLGMQAVREDEDAAEASGVGALGVKLRAFALSTALAALGGGVFAFYHISYYPQHVFSPQWTFDAVLIAFIGGVGTLHGPVLGAAFYVFLKEYLAVRWVDFHPFTFGALFVLIVLLLPGGLVEVAALLRRRRRHATR